MDSIENQTPNEDNNRNSNNSNNTKSEKFWRGPQPLNDQQKKDAKIAFGLAVGGVLGFILQLLYFYWKYSVDDWLAILVYWIVFIMPGYLANAGMLIFGGGKPLDGGKICKDGRRLFGPGKTIRGFFLGPLFFGIPIALAIHLVVYWQWPVIVDMVYGFMSDPNVHYTFYGNDPEPLLKELALYLLGDSNGTNNLETFLKLVPRVILCAFGAAVGDLFGSWAKRRKGISRGEPFWIIDQLDFVLGCLVLAGPFIISDLNIHVLIMLFVITPTITVLANTISYLSGHKKVPW